MIDLHTHTLLSDGVLIPTELFNRAIEKGYKYIAFTDHCDYSNFDYITDNIIKITKIINQYSNPCKTFSGVELTHNPPELIPKLATAARKKGIDIIVVHGETIVEPVPAGTNKAAVNADIDILAHPGLIDDETAKIAKYNNIFIEITARQGHSLTNGHVYKTCSKYNCNLIVNTDTHTPDNLIDIKMAEKIFIGAGGTAVEFVDIYKKNKELCSKKLRSELSVAEC